MPKKIGDLIDRPSLLDKLSRQTVAQKMGTTDATELDPAAPQTLPHDPRHRRCVPEWPYRRGEGQEQICTIYLRSRPQDVVGKRSPGLLKKRGHSIALALRVPDKDFAGSPVDILELKSAQLAVANACRGEQQKDGPIANVDRRCRADRIDGAANLCPGKPRRQMGQPPVRCSWNDERKISMMMTGPMHKAEKRSDMRRRGCARAGGRGERHPVLYGGEDMLRRQRSQALAGVTNAKPLQKASRAQESAVAGLRLKATYLAQIVREGTQKRSVGIVDGTGRRRHETVRRHSPRVLNRSHCRNPRRAGAERVQVPIDDGRADRL